MRITVRPCQIAGLPVSVGAGLAPPGVTMSVFAFARALLPPSLREVASGVSRKPDDGRSTPSVIAASGADSSLGEGAVESRFPRAGR